MCCKPPVPSPDAPPTVDPPPSSCFLVVALSMRPLKIPLAGKGLGHPLPATMYLRFRCEDALQVLVGTDQQAGQYISCVPSLVTMDFQSLASSPVCPSAPNPLPVSSCKAPEVPFVVIFLFQASCFESNGVPCWMRTAPFQPNTHHNAPQPTPVGGGGGVVVVALTYFYSNIPR